MAGDDEMGVLALSMSQSIDIPGLKQAWGGGWDTKKLIRPLLRSY
jgi:hypothetical protein